MAHDTDHIEQLESTATLKKVIEKVNEVIGQINHMWHPDTPDEDTDSHAKD